MITKSGLLAGNFSYRQCWLIAALLLCVPTSCKKDDAPTTPIIISTPTNGIDESIEKNAIQLTVSVNAEIPTGLSAQVKNIISPIDKIVYPGSNQIKVDKDRENTIIVATDSNNEPILLTMPIDGKVEFSNTITALTMVKLIVYPYSKSISGLSDIVKQIKGAQSFQVLLSSIATAQAANLPVLDNATVWLNAYTVAGEIEDNLKGARLFDVEKKYFFGNTLLSGNAAWLSVSSTNENVDKLEILNDSRVWWWAKVFDGNNTPIDSTLVEPTEFGDDFKKIGSYLAAVKSTPLKVSDAYKVSLYQNSQSHAKNIASITTGLVSIIVDYIPFPVDAKCYATVSDKLFSNYIKAVSGVLSYNPAQRPEDASKSFFQQSKIWWSESEPVRNLGADVLDAAKACNPSLNDSRAYAKIAEYIKIISKTQLKSIFNIFDILNKISKPVKYAAVIAKTGTSWGEYFQVIKKLNPKILSMDGIPTLKSGEINKEYIFSADGYSPTINTIYAWNFGNGTPDIQVKGDKTIKYTFTKQGLFPVRVRFSTEDNTSYEANAIATIATQDQPNTYYFELTANGTTYTFDPAKVYAHYLGGRFDIVADGDKLQTGIFFAPASLLVAGPSVNAFKYHCTPTPDQPTTYVLGAHLYSFATNKSIATTYSIGAIWGCDTSQPADNTTPGNLTITQNDGKTIAGTFVYTDYISKQPVQGKFQVPITQ